MENDRVDPLEQSPNELSHEEVTSVSLRRYQKHLRENLVLPCTVIEVSGIKPVKYTLLEILFETGGEFHGLIGVVRDMDRGRPHHIPLADLQPEDRSGNNFELTEQYTDWFIGNQ